MWVGLLLLPPLLLVFLVMGASPPSWMVLHLHPVSPLVCGDGGAGRDGIHQAYDSHPGIVQESVGSDRVHEGDRRWHTADAWW